MGSVIMKLYNLLMNRKEIQPNMRRNITKRRFNRIRICACIALTLMDGVVRFNTPCKCTKRPKPRKNKSR
jgi:hypothetical protein